MVENLENEDYTFKNILLIFILSRFWNIKVYDLIIFINL